MLPTKFQFILESGFREEDFFINQPIRKKNDLLRPCLLTDRDEIIILYREPSIDTYYQVEIHLAKRFQRRPFLKSAKQKQELPVAAMLMDRDKISNLYKGSSIDASY